MLIPVDDIKFALYVTLMRTERKNLSFQKLNFDVT